MSKHAPKHEIEASKKLLQMSSALCGPGWLRSILITWYCHPVIRSMFLECVLKFVPTDHLSSHEPGDPLDSPAAHTVRLLFTKLNEPLDEAGVGSVGTGTSLPRFSAVSEMLRVLSGNIKSQDFSEFYREFVKCVLGSPSSFSCALDHILSVKTCCM